jgi:CBS domain-containing protein
MAENALRWKPPLSWRGALDPEQRDGVPGLDLKATGTALFVEAARLLALAQGVDAVGTRERLLKAGEALGVGEAERDGWAAAFEFLQGLRLQVQLAPEAESGDAGANWVPIERLNDLDRRTLRVSLRVAQRLQQRLQLDYVRA